MGNYAPTPWAAFSRVTFRGHELIGPDNGPQRYAGRIVPNLYQLRVVHLPPLQIRENRSGSGRIFRGWSNDFAIRANIRRAEGIEFFTALGRRGGRRTSKYEIREKRWTECAPNIYRHHESPAASGDVIVTIVLRTESFCFASTPTVARKESTYQKRAARTSPGARINDD